MPTWSTLNLTVLHGNNVGWTSYLSLLVLGTPCPHQITDVAAIVLDLRVVAHGQDEGYKQKKPRG